MIIQYVVVMSACSMVSGVSDVIRIPLYMSDKSSMNHEPPGVMVMVLHVLIAYLFVCSSACMHVM